MLVLCLGEGAYTVYPNTAPKFLTKDFFHFFS